ncbi:cache domain-containing sensor histidine kinase [Paenibacillus riograndensis]|uniref:histidine kinase n=3 Tax=Paenibacillus riograndensis TaxID=483937 RepID=A0A0E4CX35_9BACL|nr:sensor histidine kinase [Paenibacillus riograndensis]CQR55942.1 putative membrane protein [Paenibacillus riograndensis SBR5]
MNRMIGLIRGMFKGYKRSLKGKLILSFLFTAILPLMVVQFIVYTSTARSMQHKINELLEGNLIQAARSVDREIASYNDLLYQIFTDEDITQLTLKMTHGSDNEQIISFGKLREKLGVLANSKDGISNISILMPNDLVVCYDKITGLATQHYWAKFGGQITDTEFYKQAGQTDQTVILPTEYADQYGEKSTHLFHLAKRMFDIGRQNKNTIGVIVISLKEEVLSEAVNYANMHLNGSGFNYIVDHNQTIISFPEKTLIGEPETNFLNQHAIKLTSGSTVSSVWAERWNKKPVLVNKQTDSTLGWSFVNITDKKEMFREMQSHQRLYLMIGVLTIVFSLLLAVYFSGKFTHSLRTIVRAMTSAKRGNLDVQLNFHTEDEIAIISSSFNSMIGQIKELVEDVKSAARQQKDAEIKALEAQINPHFLYNTLDTINWIAIENEQYKISHMLKNLAQILRYTISPSNEIVPIRKEMEWLRQYIYLQQIRFEHSFECVLEVEEAVVDCKIYKLLLQPFIENAILHGLEGCRTGGLITVTVGGYKSSCIQVRITDNGRGMTPEQLAQILNRKEQTVKKKGGGLGIHNVFTRLRLYYGQDCRWNITSQLGEGTQVLLEIPQCPEEGGLTK